MHREIDTFLCRLRLSLHPRKSRVYRCQDGFRRRLKGLRDEYYAGRIGMEEVRQSVQSWIGHAMHGDTWRLRERIFDAFPFLAGVRVRGS